MVGWWSRGGRRGGGGRFGVGEEGLAGDCDYSGYSYHPFLIVVGEGVVIDHSSRTGVGKSSY